ncbi:thiamine-binding protein [Yaniella flava]|uniref:Thiamine-binding protein n=2 Tax=Yaniella flava TaxID=287930 RepID=A0ABP5FWJ5_9MICC
MFTMGSMILAFSISVSGVGELGADAAANSTEDAATGSVARAVAAAVKVVRESGLPHRLSSMFTEIEGDWDEVMAVLKSCVEAVSPYGARISITMKADIRDAKTDQLDGKITRVNDLLDDDA